jgi:hypothetical protein
VRRRELGNVPQLEKNQGLEGGPKSLVEEEVSYQERWLVLPQRIKNRENLGPWDTGRVNGVFRMWLLSTLLNGRPMAER